MKATDSRSVLYIATDLRISYILILYISNNIICLKIYKTMYINHLKKQATIINYYL